MSHAGAADVAAIVGAIGVGLVLLGRGRSLVAAGIGAIAIAEILFGYALIPGHDLERLTGSAPRIGLLVLLLLGLGALTAGALRYPAAVPVAVALTAPFRVPVTLGDQKAFLLLPLYAVLVAGALALLVRVLQEVELPDVARLLAVPSTALVGLWSLSLLWSEDVRAGTIELAFFLFPFAVLVAVVARSPLAEWLPKALGVTVVALGCGLAAVGLSQLWTENLYFARDLAVSNAYTTYFRTTSLFADSSIYGRQLVVAMVVVVAALWLARVVLWAGVVLLALLGVALYFSYSQSSMVALVAGVLGVSLIAADRLNRRVLLVGTAVIVAAAIVIVATSVRGDSAQRFTSGRSTLVQGTWRVFADHPLVGVGVGAQPKASREAGGRQKKAKNASHTAPLTVAAELGILGVAAYLAFLAGACRLLWLAYRENRGLVLGLIGVLIVLFVHSLFYSAFFEDPLTWGALAVAAAVVAASRVRALAPERLRPGLPSAETGEPTPAP